MTSRYPFAVIKEKLHARRGEVTDFAMGRRRLALPVEIDEWIEKNASLALRPASPDAVDEFKQAALDLLDAEYGVRLTPENVVPVPGGRVAMTAVAACALQPGDAVVVTEPGYPAFARLASHFHAEVVSVSLNPDKAFAPELSEMSEAQRDSARVLSLNYPNNPTGALLEGDALQDVLRVARDSGAVVFNDNVYGPLTYHSAPGSLLQEQHGADVVELHALTKLYPIGPQGASFLAGTSETLQRIASYAEFAWAPMSGMQLGATARCFRDRVGRQDIRAFFLQQITALRDVLAGLGLKPYPTPGGIYVLCKSPTRIGDREVSSAEEAAVILLDEYDIAVVPWDPAPHAYLRFTSMYRPEDLQHLQKLEGRLELA